MEKSGEVGVHLRGKTFAGAVGGITTSAASIEAASLRHVNGPVPYLHRCLEEEPRHRVQKRTGSTAQVGKSRGSCMREEVKHTAVTGRRVQARTGTAPTLPSTRLIQPRRGWMVVDSPSRPPPLFGPLPDPPPSPYTHHAPTFPYARGGEWCVDVVADCDRYVGLRIPFHSWMCGL